MTLIDDPRGTVLEPLYAAREGLRLLYDFELMEGGGRVSGRRVTGELADSAAAALEALPGSAKLVIGDGNHSLAAAKALWDELKPTLTLSERETHPARRALVEVNNVYDPAIDFNAIHRVVFGVDAATFTRTFERHIPRGDGYTLYIASREGELELGTSFARIGDLIGAVQDFLDNYGARVDYIHGDDAVLELARREGTVGIILPAMDKSDFFATVTSRGTFPRKSFSIGLSRDKRYYLECRRIAK
jgi:hypothetical protein